MMSISGADLQSFNHECPRPFNSAIVPFSDGRDHYGKSFIEGDWALHEVSTS